MNQRHRIGCNLRSFGWIDYLYGPAAFFEPQGRILQRQTNRQLPVIDHLLHSARTVGQDEILQHAAVYFHAGLFAAKSLKNGSVLDIGRPRFVRACH